MADVGGNSSGRSHERYVPSYEAPTAPIPAIPAEDGSIISPRVPRRFPIGDGEETALVSRPNPSGSSPRPSPPGIGRPGAASGDRADGPGPDAGQVRESGGFGTIPVRQVGGSAGPWRPDRMGAGVQPGGGGERNTAAGWPGTSQRPEMFGEPAPRIRAAKRGGLLMRIGDIPIRVAYSLGAAVVTVVIVVLIFILFSGDQPSNQVEADRTAVPTVRSSPAVTPITLPALPAATTLRVLPGTPSAVLGAVTDTRSALTYASLGEPWATAVVPSFSVAQRVGKAGLPRTVIASGPLPGATPAKALQSAADYRRAALSAVRWTIRNHYPAGGQVAWTASQSPADGRGWVLGYRVTYEVKGKKRSSEAALAVLDVGRRKPSMLFVTVPDTRKRLWADIAPVMASVRAL